MDYGLWTTVYGLRTIHYKYNQMKKKYLLILGIACGLQAAAQDSVYLFSYFKGNGEDGLHLAASTDGLQWQALRNDQSWLQPQLSKDKLMRDPCIIAAAGGGYHLVWTVSWNDRGIGYAYSPDLIHWSPQQYIPVMQHEDSALNCWAPEITYDPRKRRYILYWATTIPGRFAQGSTSGDSRYNHRMYYTTTRRFKKFTRTRLLYEPGFNVIDATLFAAGPRSWGMVLKDETRYPPQKNLKLAYSRHLHKGWSAAGPPITGPEWAEGPSIIRTPGRWIIYFDKYRDKKYGAIASTDLQSWQDISAEVNFPPGTRHGTVLKVPYAVYARLLAVDTQ